MSHIALLISRPMGGASLTCANGVGSGVVSVIDVGTRPSLPPPDSVVSWSRHLPLAPPADCWALGSHAADVSGTCAQGRETTPFRWLTFPSEDERITVSPTGHLAIFPESTGVSTSGHDLYEGAGLRAGLAFVIISPAYGCSIGSEATDVMAARRDGRQLEIPRPTDVVLC